MSTQLSGAITVASQNLYDEAPDALHNLGSLVFSNDGRAFRYAGAGATALESARIQQSKAENTSDQNLAIAAAAVGASTIVTTSTVTMDLNEYAGGFAVVSVTPGIGKIYKISGHLQATAAVVTLNLADNIEVALTTSSKIDLVANKYKEVIVNPVTATSAPVGVAIRALAANTFGWLGVSGPQPVQASAAIAVGTPVIPYRTSGGPGAVTESNSKIGGDADVIGVALSGIALNQSGIIDMKLL